MKTVYIYGNISHYDHGLEGLLKRTRDVFSELGAETETVDLGALHPPYYDGETTNALDGVMEKIKSADGVVLACTAQNFAPTALMQSFLEYLTDYTDVLNGKHVMLITLSKAGGEKSAGDYLTRIVQFYGGYVAANMGLRVHHLGESEVDEFVDKTTQDFYRAVHQKRKYIIPSDYMNDTSVAKKSDAHIKESMPEKSEAASKPSELSNGFTDTQEKEIDELSLLFSQKHNTTTENSSTPNVPTGLTRNSSISGIGEGIASHSRNDSASVPSNPFAPTETESKSRWAKSGGTTKGAVQALTQRLPEFFNSQLSAGLQAVIQFNITGSENFDGAISIHSTECTYIEGNPTAPDIIIMADTSVWHDVLKNKNSAQKAFMTGGIKVRGDFVLLSKFDTLFNFPNS
jgi:putative sterol carrier protein/multimeric flavodoxin WrbA